ncbi:unnamed protein product [Symbiodinium sp. CCMP2456]|nr:unnamed protein product [Symbiodinium sp. CCMP2456]
MRSVMKAPNSSKPLEEFSLRCWLIQYKCLGGTRRFDGGATIQVRSDVSLSPEGANFGASIAPGLGAHRKTKSEALSPKPQLRIDGGAGSSNVGISSGSALSPSVAQSERRGRGRRGKSSASQPKTMGEKILLIFDDMLYCIEKYDLVENYDLIGQTTPPERKFVNGCCSSVDDFLQMATKKKKQQRWKERAMPAGLHEVKTRMLKLGMESCSTMYSQVLGMDVKPLWAKAGLLALLSWWMTTVQAADARGS